jgi:hypothetical protein
VRTCLGTLHALVLHTVSHHTAHTKYLHALCCYFSVTDRCTAGWSLLRSLFTEVLSSADWLKLWDHLFTASNDLFLLNAAAVAYTIANRDSLLAAKTRADVETFFHHQQVRMPIVTVFAVTAIW